MKLEDIVCDYEYSKKLNRLGLRSALSSKSLFWQMRDNQPSRNGCIGWGQIATYTVAELGEMLPTGLSTTDYLDFEYHGKDCGGYTYYYNSEAEYFTDEKEANARAKLLIWLIENNHITIEELNK